MNCLCLETGALGQALGGATGRGTERNRDGLGDQNFSSELISVVFPTPGPPVMTVTLDESATLSAAFWLSASASFVLCSTHGMALST